MAAARHGFSSTLEVNISGMLLSNLISSVALDPELHDAEGLLFGNCVRMRERHATDGRDEEHSTQVRYGIHDYLCSGAPFSFSGSDGRISSEKFAALSERRDRMPVIGVFVYREESPAVPSVRERTLLRSLEEQRTDGSPPPLLLLLSSSIDASGTHEFVHRCFLRHEGTGKLQAVRTKTLNLKDNAEAAYDGCFTGPDLFNCGDCTSAGPDSYQIVEPPASVRELEGMFEHLVGLLDTPSDVT